MLKCNIKNGVVISLFLLYFLAHFQLLTIQQCFWDDWVLYNMPKDILEKAFAQASFSLIGTIHWILAINPWGISLVRELTFILFGATGIFLYRSLKLIFNRDEVLPYLVTAFFLVLPVNISRSMQICFFYTVSVFLFILGLYLFLKLEEQSYIKRCWSLFCFFVSFFVNSFLVFYLVVPVYLFYKNRGLSLRELGKVFLKKLDFILLPITFYICKTLFWMPSGIYAVYNQITLDKLIHAILFTPVKTFEIFYGMLSSSFNIIGSLWILFIVLMICFIAWSFYKGGRSQILRFTVLISFSLLLLYLSIFPYIVSAGEDIIITGYVDRYLLIANISFAFSLAVLFAFLPARTRYVFFVILAALFIIRTNSLYLDFQKADIKNCAVLDYFKTNQEKFPRNTAYYFVDEARDYNYGAEEYRPYELSGMMKKAFGDESRVGALDLKYFVWAKAYLDILKKEGMLSYYNMGEYTGNGFAYRVRISKTTDVLSLSHIMKLVWYKYFEQSRYILEARSLINITVNKL